MYVLFIVLNAVESLDYILSGEMSGIQIILVLLVGGLASIESVLENSQFERPLIVCTLLGLILGDIKSGIILGGTLEMMSMGWKNIGAALPPDVALVPWFYHRRF